MGQEELKAKRKAEREKRAAEETTDTAGLLAELSTLDEVSAWAPTAMDHQQGITPQWCELVLEVSRSSSEEIGGDFPINATLPLRTHDGELLIEVLHQVLHPNAGMSIAQMIWSELDDVVDRIQKRVAKGKAPMKTDIGEARGLAMALAILTNPYAYDVDTIRAEAMERWEARNG